MSTTTKTDRPAPPETLDGEALLEWFRLCDQLIADGTIAGADMSMMMIYARTYATWVEADKHVARFGAVIKHHNGVAGVNPFYKVAEKLGPQLVLMREKIVTVAARRAGAAPKGEGLDF
jgi:P27 family predicted phage terminase small subunit